MTRAEALVIIALDTILHLRDETIAQRQRAQDAKPRTKRRKRRKVKARKRLARHV
ncbi:hypothetical protein [Azospirillum thermophilum]|uniref:hypothetical protein n=1 Tax=Azospirillum thermophilum TaxID=2202148 RepID=UPI00143D62A5|nr:hypothetical protein [Azospirillum thermophilum]